MAAEEPAKKKRAGWNKQNEMLPDALNALEPKDIIQLISEEIVLERDCEPFTMGKKYYKAVSIEIPHSGDGAGEKQTFDFANLNIRQLRKVAASLGVRNSSRMVKDTILITMGQLSKIGVVVNDGNNILPTTTTVAAAGVVGGDTKRYDTKRYNTIVRLINVIFSEGFVQGFLKWNDQRNRDDHETGVGGKMQRLGK